jgi:DNA-binding MarR family transcriptional regulator
VNAPFEADPLLSNRIRAGVLAYLSDRGAADFTELAAALGLANNTLSSHLQRLEEAVWIELRRGFLGRKPRTRIVLTPTGRDAWAAHLDRLG